MDGFEIYFEKVIDNINKKLIHDLNIVNKDGQEERHKKIHHITLEHFNQTNRFDDLYNRLKFKAMDDSNKKPPLDKKSNNNV